MGADGIGMRRTALAAAIAACFPAMGLAAGVARVDFSVGDVSAVGADGRSRSLAKGGEVQVGDTVATGGGRAQLRFADGAFMSLQPGTEFKVDQFQFSGKPNDESDNIVMSLFKGGMRTITGLVGRANRNNYQMKTAVATIGIRGTEYSVTYGNSVNITCAGGTIFVQNDAGGLELGPGQSGYVKDNFTHPAHTGEKPTLAPTGLGTTSVLNLGPPTNPFPFPLPEKLLNGTGPGNIAVTLTDNYPSSFIEKSVSLTAGALVSFTDDRSVITKNSVSFEGPQTVTLLNGSVVSQGNDGTIAWGRWVSGQTSTGSSSFGGRSLSEASPLHYVVGLPVTNMPTTGSATYNMIGATTPSFTGSIGSARVDSSSIVVDFASTSAKFNAQFTVDGNALYTQPGGVYISRYGSQLSFYSGYSLIGPYSNRQLYLTGFLSGDGASRAGVAYRVQVDPGTFNGAIAYKKN